MQCSSFCPDASTYRCKLPVRHPLPHQFGGYVWLDDGTDVLAMTVPDRLWMALDLLDAAARVLVNNTGRLPGANDLDAARARVRQRLGAWLVGQAADHRVSSTEELSTQENPE